MAEPKKVLTMEVTGKEYGPKQEVIVYTDGQDPPQMFLLLANSKEADGIIGTVRGERAEVIGRALAVVRAAIERLLPQAPTVMPGSEPDVLSVFDGNVPLAEQSRVDDGS